MILSLSIDRPKKAMPVTGQNWSVAAIALSAMVLVLGWSVPASAQELPAQSSGTVKSVTATVLVVDPTKGNDSTADGSDRAPFKTLTQALKTAHTGTIIQLIPGTYSEDSGERFPLQMKSGVTIQGNPSTRGIDVILRGSGYFLSPTSARQSVTLLGATGATVTGITITNPHPQGYGLWVESSNPTVTDNTFTASGHDGISVVGNGAPLIRNNYFVQNGANGITIYGTSQSELRENIFEQTGFAINVNQQAVPLIIGNRITQNKSGIIVQAKARPTLRNNSIEDNQQDGLVAIAQSRPNLGVAGQPGGNFIRNNGQFDINAKATSERIPAFGNELAKSTGNVDLMGDRLAASTAGTDNTKAKPIAFGDQLSPSPQTAAPVAPNPTAAPSTAALPAVLTSSTAANLASAFPVPSALSGKPESLPRRPLQIVRLATVEPTSPPTASRLTRAPAAAAPTVVVPTTAPPLVTQSAPTLPSRIMAAKALSLKTDRAIAIPVPAPETPLEPVAVVKSARLLPPGQTPQPTSVAEPGLLPVPAINPPLGNVGKMASAQLRGQDIPSDGSSPPLPPDRGALVGVRYRVVVQAETSDQQAQIKRLAPNCFATLFKGKTAIQAGAFGDRDKADQLAQMLISQGMTATVEPME